MGWTIEGQEPVDIIKMAEPMMFANKKKLELFSKLRELRKAGQNDKQIEVIIHKLNLPLSIHMFVLANYSKIMRGEI